MERYRRRTYLQQVVIGSGFLFILLTNAAARDFITDRPDRTESPYTVDAGRYQFETDIFTYTYKQQNSGGQVTTTRKYYFNQINLKAGITQRMDLQVVIPSFVVSDVDIGGIKDIKRGLGDILVRLKMNVAGNDEGPVSLGVMPFLKTPTATSNLGNSRFEGGIIMPLCVQLPKDWQIGTMAQLNYYKNENDNNYHATFISSISFGHSVVGELSGYVEFYSESSGEQGTSWVATADVGLTYKTDPNTQFDIGMNTGVTPATGAVNPFLGLSMRF